MGETAMVLKSAADSSSFFPDGRKRNWLFAIALFGLAFAVYVPSLGHGFVNYDDPGYVTENPQVLGGLTAANVQWAFSTFAESNWHPLTWISLQVDATIFGTGPFGFHFSNVLLHSLTTAILYLAFVGMTGRPERTAFMAALFAVHPLHVESVSWISERKDVLSGFFAVLTLAAYGRFAASPSFTRMLVTAIPLALGLLAKPMLVTLPCALILLDYWPLGRLNRLRDLVPRVREKWILFALVAGSAFATVTAQSAGGTLRSLSSIPFENRIGNSIVAYGNYLTKTAVPTDLAILYPLPVSVPVTPLIVSSLLLIGVTAITWMYRHKSPYFLVGWLWFIGTLVPVIGIVQVSGQAYADRYVYIPHIGLFFAISWGMFDLLARFGASRWWVAGIAITLILVFSIQTLRQEAVWKESGALWEHANDVTENNGLARRYLGIHYYEQGRYEDAAREFQEANRLMPAHFATTADLAQTLGDLGKHDEAAATARKALDLAPPTDHERTNGRIAAAWFVIGEAAKRRGNLQESLKAYGHSIQAREAWAAWNKQGIVLAQLGQPQEASKSFARALSLNPGNVEVAFNLGMSKCEAGEWAAAISPLQEAARLAPSKPQYQGMLAMALLTTGRTEEATRAAQGVASLDRTWIPRSTAIAWSLATHPDEARRKANFAYWLARTVLLVAPSAEAQDALAAALADLGRFDEAATVADAAANMAEKAGKTELASAIRQRVDLYKAKQPYRQSKTSRG